MRSMGWCILVAASSTACGWLSTTPADPPTPAQAAPPPAGSVATEPEADPGFRIALGSCYDQTAPDDTWDAVLALKPDLYIAAGDNVYADTEVVDGVLRFLADPQRVRDAYAALAVEPGWRRLVANVPVLAVWDDHDYGLNDAGAELPFADESQDAFLDFFRVPADDPRRFRPGIYSATRKTIDDLTVQVILLDTRRFRSPLVKQRGRPAGTGPYAPDPDTTKTMLGETQWAWLADQLRAPADLRLIVSGIQVLPTGHRFERWDELPHERERLLDLIGTTEARGVIFLSGDRHFGSVYRRAPSETGPGYPLWELTSSSLNKSFGGLPDEMAPLRVGPQVPVENIGLVDLDPAARAVRLALVDKQGAVVTEQTIPLDTLSPRTP